MKSNDIILIEAEAAAVIGSMADGPDSGQQKKNGGRKRDRSIFKLPDKDSKTQLARGYFVEDMMDKIHDLVKGQLDSDFSYIAKPGKAPDEDQMTLENYLTNWYSQYTKGLNVGAKLNKYSARIFKTMQEQWQNGTYKESLIRDLANATWLATQAEVDDPVEPTSNKTPVDPNQRQLDFGPTPGEQQAVNPISPGYKGAPPRDTETEEMKKIKKNLATGEITVESKTQSAIRAEKIPALKTR